MTTSRTLGPRWILSLGRLALLAAALLAACGGGGGGGGGGLPTEPGTLVLVAANLDGLGDDENLLEVELLWDGSRIAETSFPEPQLNVGFTVDVPAVREGTHTVGMTVVRQVASPEPYDLNGSIFVGGQGGTRISLGHTEATLEEGETVSTGVAVTAP